MHTCKKASIFDSLAILWDRISVAHNVEMAKKKKQDGGSYQCIDV